ncbi:MAG: hypothetical protein AAGE52_21785 [Myxococcota bacterium]
MLAVEFIQKHLEERFGGRVDRITLHFAPARPTFENKASERAHAAIQKAASWSVERAGDRIKLTLVLREGGRRFLFLSEPEWTPVKTYLDA